MSFFTALNFASSNEDGRSELKALGGPARRMLCLTGSGTRPLDMLLSEAETVIAIDLNPTQNALLRLKVAAFQTFDHREMLAYLGILPCRDRMALHARLEGTLSREDRGFWARHRRWIRAGIWYAGRWEKVLRIGAFAVKMLRGKAITALFDAPDIARQSQIWEAQFDDWIWRKSIRTLSRPWFWTRIIGEPGGAFLPSPDEVEIRLAGAFRRAAGQFLFRESDFASLILRGHNALPAALPLHLLPENFDQIRAALPRLEIVEGGLSDLEALGLDQIDRFSLSDFGSYCDADAYAACWAGILSAAAPGAAFCERSFMNPLALPHPRIIVAQALSDQLTREDRAIIYDIRAGHIGRTAND